MACADRSHEEGIEMSAEKTELEGPDFAQGVPVSTLAEGVMLLGHAHGEAVVLVRRGVELFAIGAVCTHYGGPLPKGCSLTIRCVVPGTMRVSASAQAK